MAVSNFKYSEKRYGNKFQICCNSIGCKLVATEPLQKRFKQVVSQRF